MVSNIQLDIAGLVHQQISQTLNDYIKSVDIKSLIQSAITETVNNTVDSISKSATQKLLKERDLSDEIGVLINNLVKEHLDYQVKIAVRTSISQTDIKSIINETVDKNLKIQISKFNFPNSSIPNSAINWQNAQFSGSMISGGIIKDFNSIGIQDKSTECQLTILDGLVVVENHLLAKKIKSNSVEVDNLTVNDIKILGNVDPSPNLLEKMHSISEKVFTKNTLEKNLEIDNKNIESQGKLIINKDSLGPSVAFSNLRKLGLLQDLRVQGDATFSETMFVSDQRKVGINTQEPNGVFTVWDQDAELTMMKQSSKNMFFGSTRLSDVSLGTNNQAQLILRQNEVEIKDSLRVMGIKFTVVNNIPDYAGELNEIVFVSNAREGQPLMYICKGNNTWAALGVSAV